MTLPPTDSNHAEYPNDEPSHRKPIHGPRKPDLDERPYPSADDGLHDAVGLVAASCRTPMAVLSIRTDDDWYEYRHGEGLATTTSDVPFTPATAETHEGLAIEDTHQDPRYTQHPLVTDPPGVRAYLGIPLYDPVSEKVLGTLAVLDTIPRTWSDNEVVALEAVARLVTDLVMRQRLLDGGPRENGDDPSAGTDGAETDKDWAGLRDRLSDVLARIERLQRRHGDAQAADGAV